MIKPKIDSLVEYLRSLDLIGYEGEKGKIRIVNQGVNFIYIRYHDDCRNIQCVVNRSSLQRYRIAWWDFHYCCLNRVSFRNSRLTGDYIKNLCRR